MLVVRIHEQDDGLYDVADLGTVEDLPRAMREREPPKVPLTESNALALLSRARVVLRGHDAQLAPAVTEALSTRFEQFISYSDFSVFVREP